LLVEVAGITAVAVGAVLFKGEETECGNIMGKDNSVLIFCSSSVFGASAENDEILLFKNIAFVL
jgi:hypothetical protein